MQDDLDLQEALREVGRKLLAIEGTVPIAKEALNIVMTALGKHTITTDPKTTVTTISYSREAIARAEAEARRGLEGGWKYPSDFVTAIINALHAPQSKTEKRITSDLPKLSPEEETLYAAWLADVSDGDWSQKLTSEQYVRFQNRFNRSCELSRQGH